MAARIVLALTIRAVYPSFRRARRGSSALHCVLLLAGTIGLGIFSAATHAQSSIRVGSVAARPGQSNVVIAIEATTPSLTGLDAVVGFEAALCGQIANAELLRAGRTVLPGPQDAHTILDNVEAVRCPSAGQLRLVVDDFRGGVVIPEGMGTVAELRLSVRAQAAERAFDLTPGVNQARNGAAQINLAVVPGRLVITRCTGDCHGDGNVTVDDLIRGVNIALERADVGECQTLDVSNDGEVTVDELVAAVGRSIGGCSL